MKAKAEAPALPALELKTFQSWTNSWKDMHAYIWKKKKMLIKCKKYKKNV